MKSLDDKILARLYRKGRGFVFSGVDFADLGKRPAIDKALSMLAAAGKIRRLDRGLYDYPHFDERLGGEIGPDIHEAAKAVARKNGVKIQPCGALAANLLGISTQVPAKYIYLTNGKSRIMEIDRQQIEFTRTPPKKMQTGHELSAMAAHALRWLGHPAVTDAVIASLRRKLDKRARRRLVKDLRYAEDWIYQAARRIAESGGDE